MLGPRMFGNSSAVALTGKADDPPSAGGYDYGVARLRMNTRALVAPHRPLATSHVDESAVSSSNQNLLHMLQSALLLAKVREEEEEETVASLQEQLKADVEATAAGTAKVVPHIHTKTPKKFDSPLHRSVPLVFMSDSAKSTNGSVVPATVDLLTGGVSTESPSPRTGSPARHLKQGGEEARGVPLSTLAAVTSYRYTHVTSTATENNRLRGTNVSPSGRRGSPSRPKAPSIGKETGDIRRQHFQGMQEKSETPPKGSDEPPRGSFQDELRALRLQKSAEEQEKSLLVSENPVVVIAKPQSLLEKMRQRREESSEVGSSSVPTSVSPARDTSPIPSAPDSSVARSIGGDAESPVPSSSILARLRSKQSAMSETSSMAAVEESNTILNLQALVESEAHTATETVSVSPPPSSLLSRLKAKREAQSRAPSSGLDSSGTEGIVATTSGGQSTLMQRLKQRRAVIAHDTQPCGVDVLPPATLTHIPQPDDAPPNNSLLQKMRLRRLQAGGSAAPNGDDDGCIQ